MFGSLFARLVFLPMQFGSKSPRLLWVSTLVPHGVLFLAAAAWLLAPLPIYFHVGQAWALLWAVPTGAAIFACAYAPNGGG